MRVPYRPVYLPKGFKRFRYIIMHDFSCQFSKLPKARTDTNKVETQSVRQYHWVFQNEFELPYHFVCEKIDKDFETIMARPFCYFCEYDDIPEQYLPSIHIAIAGLGMQQIDNRAYEQIAYRSVSSILRWFRLPINRVLLHSEVSTNKDLKCPADNFQKPRFVSMIKRLSIMKK